MFRRSRSLEDAVHAVRHRARRSLREVAPLVLLVACTKREAPAPARVDAAPSASAVVSEVVDAAPPLRVREYRASLADLRGDTLGECVDVSVDAVLAPDAGEPKKDPIAAMFKSEKGLTKITKSCSEQFSDRTAYATCTVSKREEDGGTSVNVQIVSHRFDFAAVADTDRYMKECLEMHGEWDAMKRDSAEWHAAKAEQTRKRLERLTR